MPGQTIISLAILKVNWDVQRRDYVENFVPMVAECVRLSGSEVVSVPEVQDQLRARFGLAIPQNAIKAILHRVRRRGYIRKEHGAYKPEHGALARLNFHDVQQRVVRMHETLISGLIAFCRERYGTTWTPEDAEAALQAYLADNQLLLAAGATQEALIPRATRSVKSAKFLVGSYVQHLLSTRAADWEYLETIVKGNMLANAIFLPDPSRAQQNFRRTKVYFDTGFLVWALGYAGEPRAAPCTELLQLLYETGADLYCFAHTIDEVRGVLDACSFRMDNNHNGDSYGPTDTLEHFVSAGYSISDIELLSGNLAKSLKALRIDVVDKPEYVPQHVMDERAFTDCLSERIQYRNPVALSRDVDSISAIVRLRQDREYFSLEECRAVFVTTNTLLADATRSFFSEAGAPNAISPCLTDYTLTNLLWLKKPLKAPSLPTKRIIADSYAATQPDERLWRLYLAEIEKLEQSGRATPDDCYLLRCSFEAKTALMSITHGEEDAFTEGTVPEILETVRSRVQAEVRAELDAERARREAAEQQLRADSVRAKEQAARLTTRANSYAHAIAQASAWTIRALLLLATAYTFPWHLPSIAGTGSKYLAPVGFVVLLVLTVENLYRGTTIETFLRRFESTLSGAIERKLKRLLGD